MRKAIVALVALVVVALGADYGTAIYCESHYSTVLRKANGLRVEPEVAMTGFPFLATVTSPTMSKLSVNDPWVDLGDGRSATASSQLTDVHTDGTWLLHDTSSLTAAQITSQMRLDSVNLGRFLHIPDLTVATPAPHTAGAGSPADAWTEATSGILLTGTVSVGNHRFRTTVTADVGLQGGAISLTATGFYTGPEVHQPAPRDSTADIRAAILRAFSATLPPLPLPWGITPDDVRSSGGQLLLSGTARHRSVVAADFRPDLR